MTICGKCGSLIKNKVERSIIKDGIVCDLNGQAMNGRHIVKVEKRVIYDGELENGIKHGQGTLILADGAKYEGQFQNGKYDGRGTLIFANGAKYEGQFRNGKYDGRGTLIFADGAEHKGEFRNGKIYNGKYIITVVKQDIELILENGNCGKPKLVAPSQEMDANLVKSWYIF
jgi:hypothetical protein